MMSGTVQGGNITHADVASGAGDDDNLLLIFVLWGVLLPLVAGAGLVGNVLTMLVLWRREMNSTTILYLRGLVITDTGILIGSVITLTPLACADYLQSDALGYFKYSIYPLLRTPGYYIIMTLQQINVWITVSVSVERYVAICHPFRAARFITRKHTVLLMIGLAVFSVFYNLPRVFASTTVACNAGVSKTGENGQKEESMRNNSVSQYGEDEQLSVKVKRDILFSQWTSLAAEITESSTSEMRTTLYQTVPYLSNSNLTYVTPAPSHTASSSCLEFVATEFGTTSFYTFYRTIMYLIIIYVLPFLALLVLNSFLIRELMTMQRRNVNASRKEENEANLSLVLVLIVIVFIFCQTPGLISQFDIFKFSLFIPWLAFSNFLFVTNSAVNFLIYTAFGRKFRRVLLRVCRHISSYNVSTYTRSRGTSMQLSQAPLQSQHSPANGNTLVELSALATESDTTTKHNKIMDDPSVMAKPEATGVILGSSQSKLLQNQNLTEKTMGANGGIPYHANCEGKLDYSSFCTVNNSVIKQVTSLTKDDLKTSQEDDIRFLEHGELIPSESKPLRKKSVCFNSMGVISEEDRDNVRNTNHRDNGVKKRSKAWRKTDELSQKEVTVLTRDKDWIG